VAAPGGNGLCDSVEKALILMKSELVQLYVAAFASERIRI